MWRGVSCWMVETCMDRWIVYLIFPSQFFAVYASQIISYFSGVHVEDNDF